jgi:hypothetical protein
MEKPRIKRGLIWLRQSPPALVEGWYCISQSGFYGGGLTPSAAYADWLRQWLAINAVNRLQKHGWGYQQSMTGGNPYAHQP